MKAILLLISLVSFSSFAGTLEQEHLKSIDAREGLLVKMTASWCRPCIVFKKKVEVTKEFKQALSSNSIKLVSADFSYSGEVGELENRYLKFFGKVMPTLILLNPEGQQQMLNNQKPSPRNFRVINSRTLYKVTKHLTIQEEIAKGAKELRIK